MLKKYSLFVFGLLTGLAFAVAIAFYLATPPETKKIDSIPANAQDKLYSEQKTNPNDHLWPQQQHPDIESILAVKDSQHPDQEASHENLDTASTPSQQKSIPSESAKPLAYFIKSPAYTTLARAQEQKALLAIQGHESTIVPQHQGEEVNYQLLLGPFERRETAEQAQTQLTNIEDKLNIVKDKQSESE